jgi:plastocyanin
MTHLSRRLVLVAAAAGLLVSAGGATAGPVPAPALAVAPPQGAILGFASPVVVAVQGQAVSFANVDVVGHTLTAVGTKPQRLKYGKRWYTIRVPLFDSGGVNAAAVGDVKGVMSLKPGSYAFYCAMHTSMKGTLVVKSAS